jgi:hypothetical protein
MSVFGAMIPRLGWPREHGPIVKRIDIDDAPSAFAFD